MRLAAGWRPRWMPSQVSRGLARKQFRVRLRRLQPAEMLAVALQLQPPPEHRRGRDLARVHQRGPALPGPVHADAQVKAIGWLTGEGMAGLPLQSAGDAGGQGPREHWQ